MTSDSSMEKTTIAQIWDHYREDLTRAEDKIKEALGTVAPAISAVGNHLLASGGKRIRPFLAIISSKLFGPASDSDKVSTLACSVEFIHTASLIHDDVVDGADIRRGQPSAHSLWGNQAVVLVGDFLYANALRLANLLNHQGVMDALCTATAKMSEGELVQLSKKGNPDITEEDYMKIIQGKTAILMSAACRGGSVIGGASSQQEEAFTSFGLKFGYAFQMVDDILDYMAEESSLGKTLGKDLEEGKITLPLINLLRDADINEVNQIKEIIKTEKLKETDLAFIQHKMGRYNSIGKSYDRAKALLDEARTELDIFQDSFEKKSLLTISEYVVSRKK